MSLTLNRSLLQGCQLLDSYDIFDEHGHLSSRLPADRSTFRINAQSSPRTAGLDDFIDVQLNENNYPDAAPSETCIHAEIFRQRDDVNSICHNHSRYATLISSLGIEMRPAHSNGAVQKAPVTIYDDYDEEGGGLITTNEEARSVADALGNESALLLRGHGVIVVGETVEEAIVCSIKLEYNAELVYKQQVADEPWYLPESLVEEDVARVHSESGIKKSLDYYLEELD